MDRQNLAEHYRSLRVKYDAFSDQVKSTISTALVAEGIFVHDISARSKDIKSYCDKATKKLDDGEFKYQDPINQITDLAGVRIVCYNLQDVQRVRSFIHDQFKVDDEEDVGQSRFESGKFGYQSIHFLVKFTPERSEFPEFKIHSDLICEIQVRTVLQHAWAEIEHKLRYKGEDPENKSLGRKFTSLAGLLEVADREFQSIMDAEAQIAAKERERLTEEAEDLISVLTEEDSEETTSSLSSTEIKKLIEIGDYQTAIDAYDEKITEAPTMHTLYIGRARARFLFGDFTGAMSDLDKAQTLSSQDQQIEKMRDQFLAQGGLSELSSSVTAHQLVRSANRFLSAGNGFEAKILYEKAFELGAPSPSITLYKAMAHCVQFELTRMISELDNLRLKIGTPMAVNLSAMYAIYDILSMEHVRDSHLEELRESINKFSAFKFQASPLRHLEKGLLANSPEDWEKLSPVFDTIGRED
jgi:ppGpp synthetase/RelA/SpoT-type nucleotidyltranferase